MVPFPRNRAYWPLVISGALKALPMAVEENLFKYHAACYLTHSTIEAIRDLKRRHNIGLGDVEKITLKIDPGFLQGSADRALGRWYYKVPGLFGGSNKQSEAHLRKSLTYNPDSVISHFFLAETLEDMGRKDQARTECQAAIDAPFDPDWTPEDTRFKESARRLLRTQQR